MSRSRSRTKIYAGVFAGLTAAGAAGTALLGPWYILPGGNHDDRAAHAEGPQPEPELDKAQRIKNALALAYGECQPSGDLDKTAKVVTYDQVDSTIQYHVDVQRNPAIEAQADELGIVYTGLVAKRISYPGVPQTPDSEEPRGTIVEIGGQLGEYQHRYPSIDVFGPNSVNYNLLALAQAVDPLTGETWQSETPCGGLIIEGHANRGITRIAASEFSVPVGAPAVTLSKIPPQ